MTKLQAAAIITVATVALVFTIVVEARAAWVEDARLVEPTAWTHYNRGYLCPGDRTFSRVLVLTPRGHRFGPRHRRRNGDTIWRDPAGGVVKWTTRGTIINHATRTAMFVAFCANVPDATGVTVLGR